MGPPAGFPKNRFINVKQDSVVSIYLRTLLPRTTLLESFLHNNGTDSLNNMITCNQLLVKVSILILIIISLRQQGNTVAHEASNRRFGDSDTHILGVVMEFLSEDLPTLFPGHFPTGA